MKKVLLLAAAVLTIGTATAQLGLNGTFGKPVSNALHKVLDAVKIDSQDIREAKTAKVARVGSTEEMKAVARDAKPAFEGVAAPVKQISVSGEFVLAPEKAEIMKKIAAKAPAALGERYNAKAAVYKDADQKWYWSNPYIMETFAYESEGVEYAYMIDVIPDNFSGWGGVPASYTYKENGDGTTAITIDPQWMGMVQGLDIFILDYTDLFKNGGDGAVKMTLAADGNITFDNPGHVVGYFATPAEEDYDVITQGYPQFVPENIVGAVEQCQQVTYTLPEPDTFVAEVVYNGTGTDFQSNKPVEWEMQMGKNKDGNIIRDLVPSVESKTGIPTDVEYTVEGNNIIVKPQFVGNYMGYYLYMFDWDSEDGSIILTKDENGYITTNVEKIFIGAFTQDVFDPSKTHINNGGTYGGLVQRTDNAKYFAEGQERPVEAPTATYDPAFTMLNVTLSTNGYSMRSNNSMVPGYAEIPYSNTSTNINDATSWSWEICDSIFNAETRTYSAGNTVKSTDENFSFLTQGSATYGQPILTATNTAGEQSKSATYTIGGYINCGDDISSYGSSETGDWQASLASIKNSLVAYSDYGTPDVSGNQGTTTFALYQGKPAAPLYFTGINLMVYKFTQNSDFNLTARIVEATRSANGRLTLGETIAYADASEYVAMSETQGFLYFKDMYVLDEDEMSESIDHLFIDKEFAIVIDGWNNGTFSGIPVVERNNPNENGLPNIFFDYEGYSGYTNFMDDCTHMYVGFNEAVCGYLHTTSGTNFTALTAGEEFTISVDDAMFHSVNEAGESSARVFASDDCPEWITLSVANVNEKATAFDIKVTVEKNEGAAREAKFYIYQEGAKIDVTVSQTGDSDVNTGINGVNADKVSAPRYNAAGQRVNANAKGIVISNGKKQIAK
ncbi:MAG: hypothetical protein K2H97_03240 [Prevotella sp.]|nr:hypothetical protein [Prevotella sp.]